MEDLTVNQRLRFTLKRFLLRLLPPCKEIARIISASFDRRLTIREKFVLRLHLIACKPCSRYLEQSEFLSKATGVLDEKLKEELFSAGLSDEARERLKKLIEASAET
jgi:hypothetical protein